MNIKDIIKRKKFVKELKEKNNSIPIRNRALDSEEIRWLYKCTKPAPRYRNQRIRENGKYVYYGPYGEKY